MLLLYILLVGLIAGWATGKLMKGSGYGVLTDILLGLVGAFIGSRALGLLGIHSTGGPIGGVGLISIVPVAIIGAVALVALVRVLKKA